MTSGSSSTNGSSPRERGTDKETQELSQAPRFIPACAGNSWHGHLSHGCTPVHPRVRGEQGKSIDTTAAVTGSSPRARGTDHPSCRIAFGRRFIPACAGNSSQTKFTSSACPVHPRVRGEQGDVDRRVVAVAGSSPRARGTGGQVLGRAAGGRFIPACAGNSWAPSTTPTAASVHPRVRGEQGTILNQVSAGTGSSPRARGTASAPRWPPAETRFIPACAGNSPRRRRCTTTRPVHPRVRGEQARHHRRCGKHLGSSPRARGTVQQMERVRRRLRFIPACAGNRPSLSC